MSKLYVGNLPADISEAKLRQLFNENNLPSKTILIKRGGYAFVDCADQTTADKAIDILNGTNFFGTQIVVEPSVAGSITAKKKNPDPSALPGEQGDGFNGDKSTGRGTIKVDLDVSVDMNKKMLNI